MIGESPNNFEDRYGDMPYRATLVTERRLPDHGWELKACISIRKVFRKIICATRGHDAVNVANNLWQCGRCYVVEENIWE